MKILLNAKIGRTRLRKQRVTSSHGGKKYVPSVEEKEKLSAQEEFPEEGESAARS